MTENRSPLSAWPAIAMSALAVMAWASFLYLSAAHSLFETGWLLSAGAITISLLFLLARRWVRGALLAGFALALFFSHAHLDRLEAVDDRGRIQSLGGTYDAVGGFLEEEESRLAEWVDRLAADPSIVDVSVHYGEKKARIEAFEALALFAAHHGIPDYAEGIAFDIVSSATGQSVAWWGDLPDVDRAPIPGGAGIMSDPFRLYLVVERPLETFDISLPTGHVRVLRPVGINPLLRGRFGRDVPFAVRLHDVAGREVQLHPLEGKKGRPVKGASGRPLGRAQVVLPPLELERDAALQHARHVLGAILALFWTACIPWPRLRHRKQLPAEESGGDLKFWASRIPILPILIVRLIILLFRWPAGDFDLADVTGIQELTLSLLGGFFRTPLDLALTAAALLAPVIVLRERLAGGENDLGRKVGRRSPLAMWGIPVLAMAILSIVTYGFHLLIRRLLFTSELELFRGPSPLDSVGALLIEGGILFFAAAYLLLIDAGFVWAGRSGFAGRGLAGRLSFPVRFALATIFALATLFLTWWCARGAESILFYPAATLSTGFLLLFLLRGRGWRLWNGLGFIAALVIVTHGPVRVAQDDIARIHLQERALRFADPADEEKRLVLEKALQVLRDDEKLAEKLMRNEVTPAGRDAFSAWIRSGLSQSDHSCDLLILDRQGAVVNRFSMDMPAQSAVRAAFAFRELRGGGEGKIESSRRVIRGRSVESYTGVTPIRVEEELVGAVIITVPYFIESLEYASNLPSTSHEIFRNYRSAQRSLPDPEDEIQVLHYVGERLIRSSDDRPPVVPAPGPDLLEKIVSGRPIWLTESHSGKRYDVFYTGWKDPAREGVLAYARKKAGWIDHVKALIDMTLIDLFLAVCFVVLSAPVLIVLSITTGPLLRVRPEPTFQDKLVLAFLLIALLPAVLLGGAGRRMVSGYVAEAGEDEARTSLQAVLFALDQEAIREAEELARSTFVRRKVLGIDEEERIDLEVGLKRFAILTPAGDLILQNGRIGEVNREAIAEVRDRRTPLTAFEYTDQLSIVALVGITIEGFEDDLEGVLLLSRPIDEALISRLGERVGRDLTFFKGGDLAVSTRRELYQAGILSTRLPANVYLPLELRGERIRFGREQVAETPYLVGYSSLQGLSGEPVGTIAVPLLFREHEANRDVQRAYAAITYLTFATLLVIIVIAEVMGQRIARPVADISQGMKRVAEGDLGVAIRRGAGGEIGRLVEAFNRMTSDLKRSREELTERTRYIETILQSVGTGVIAFEERGRVVSANPAAARILDVPVEDLPGEKLENLRGGLFRPLQQLLEEIDRTGDRLHEEEVELSGPGGRVVALRVVASMLTDEEGSHLGKVIVFEDLTALIQSKKLLAWGEMARQVAHEIKNPLTPIKLSVQQIRRAYHDGHKRFGEILDESTDLIIEEIESLRRIATEFSAFARMPRRRLELVDAGLLVADVVRLYEGSIPGGRIRVDLPPEKKEILVDRQEFRRVLINLLENGVQAIKRSGNIDVALSVSSGSPTNDEGWEIWESTPEAPREGDLLVFRIADDGSGVSEGARGKLFEPNFSTKTNGTGLGLAISRAIVEGYGGSIMIGSTRDKGTAVFVSIPLGSSV